MRLSLRPISYDDTGTTIAADLAFERLPEADFAPAFHFPPGWQIDPTVSPFVPFAVAVAAWYGEDLVIDSPVHDQVLASAEAAAPLLASFAQRPPITITATARPTPPRPAQGRSTSLFVSRGVDSSACLVLAEQGRLQPAPDLGIIVSGIEPFRSADEAALAVDQALHVTSVFDIEPLVVRTNVWEQVHPRVQYANVHGSALFGIALALAHHLEHVVIASAAGWRSPALGSHRELDHLWGNDTLAIHLLPADMERSERVRVIAEDRRPLEWLRVCWLEPTRNCGHCRKCILTAALLDHFGVLEHTPTFDRGPVDAEELRRHPPGLEFLDDLRAVLGDERPELANAALLSQDRLNDPWRTAPELVRLRRLTELEAPGARATSWCYLGPAGADAAAAIEAATTAFGPGFVWADDRPLARPILERVLSSCRFAVWDGPDDALDTERVLVALEHGARPVQVVGMRVDRSLPDLPAALAAIARAPDELAGLVDEPSDAVVAMARALAAGGSGWMRRAS